MLTHSGWLRNSATLSHCWKTQFERVSQERSAHAALGLVGALFALGTGAAGAAGAAAPDWAGLLRSGAGIEAAPGPEVGADEGFVAETAVETVRLLTDAVVVCAETDFVTALPVGLDAAPTAPETALALAATADAATPAGVAAPTADDAALPSAIAGGELRPPSSAQPSPATITAAPPNTSQRRLFGGFAKAAV